MTMRISRALDARLTEAGLLALPEGFERKILLDEKNGLSSEIISKIERTWNQSFDTEYKSFLRGEISIDQLPGFVSSIMPPRNWSVP